MKRIIEFLILAIYALCISTVYSQSLGDLAKKEKERREAVKDERVITDEKVTQYKSGPETAKIVSDKTPDAVNNKKDSEDQ